MNLWIAFSLGLMGSMHCVGMCGPIALALPFKRESKSRTIKNVVLYNIGRAFTYSLIGVLPGLIGTGLILGGMQKSFSIILGVLFVLAAFFSFRIDSIISNWSIFKTLLQKVQHSISTLLKENKGAFFVIGILNGFLPCGLVYMAAATAVTQYTVWSSMIFMFVFGLGTLPMMAVLALTGHMIGVRARNLFKKLIPIFLLIFAILFIMRGLNVELPSDVQFWLDQAGKHSNHK